MNGFLGTRGSFMLDLVVAAMFVTVPILCGSIFLVRRRAYQAHKRIQLSLACVLLATVVAFEAEMRFVGWQDRATASRYWSTGPFNDWVDYSLVFHLLCAIPTFVVWAWVVWKALSNFPVPPHPTDYSRSHRLWGRLAVIGLLGTAVSGWVFYWFAFIV
jgi:uncharacterized membrane protein YozB (DUF420 family)